MKVWFSNNWPKLIGFILITGLIILFVFRKSIFESNVAKAKMEIFQGAQEQDQQRISRGLDSLKRVIKGGG